MGLITHNRIYVCIDASPCPVIVDLVIIDSPPCQGVATPAAGAVAPAVNRAGCGRSAGELDYFSAHIRLREPSKSEDKAEAGLPCMTRAAGELDYFSAHIRLREPGKLENRIGTSPAIRWRRPCIRVVVYLSIDQLELLEGHSGVKVDGRKGRGSDNESSGAQLPKSKASVRKEVDSEEHHSAAEADLLIVKEGMQMQGNG
ncbi:hypothetical protein GW17_00019142 [Ensete ventricosum]|nr:hypothetical protein GW17_00019142 [Ensete ventricosum]